VGGRNDGVVLGDGYVEDAGGGVGVTVES